MSGEGGRDGGSGWSLETVVAWLAREGRKIAEPALFVEALGLELIDIGAPVMRLRVGCQTIHPQIAAWSVGWQRGTPGADEFRASHGITERDTYRGSPVEHLHKTGRPFRRRLVDLEEGRDHLLLHELAAEGGTDYLALPLVFSDGQINFFTLVTDGAPGFADADIEKFTRLVDHAAPILEVYTTRRIAQALLDTYVGRRTGERVLKGQIKRGDGEVIEAALWFSDLRDFTPLTENLEPKRLLAMLNAYFETVAAAVTARGGEVLRFIGDAMLIVFPIGPGTDKAAACVAAVDAAIDAFDSVAAVNSRRRRAGEPPIRFGVGLDTGTVIYGNVGAADRLDFTVMGPAVNRTARLEALTKELGRALLMSADVAGVVASPTESLGRHRMKGVAAEQEVFALVDGP